MTNKCPGCDCIRIAQVLEDDDDDKRQIGLPEDIEAEFQKLDAEKGATRGPEDVHDPANPWYKEERCPGCGHGFGTCTDEWHGRSQAHGQLSGVPLQPSKGMTYDPMQQKWLERDENFSSGGVPQVEQSPSMGMGDLPKKKKEMPKGLVYHLTVKEQGASDTETHRSVHTDKGVAQQKLQEALDAGFDAKLEPVQQLRGSVCDNCGGSAVCRGCRGRGRVGSFGYRPTCESCVGSGICLPCNGLGITASMAMDEKDPFGPDKPSQEALDRAARGETQDNCPVCQAAISELDHRHQ